MTYIVDLFFSHFDFVVVSKEVSYECPINIEVPHEVKHPHAIAKRTSQIMN